jgi:two-component system, NtrC family, nitrogen regulation sensor histidine kinase GlnL
MMTEPERARLLDNLNTAVLVLDGEMRFRYLNPAGEILFEVSARHMLGHPLRELLPGETLLAESLSRSIDSGHPYTEREVELRLPNQRTITVDITVTPLNESRADRVLLLELNRVDRHLRIAREESLIAQNQNTRLLMRGMAHEINNPLGGLRGAAQLLDRELDDPGLREYTSVIIGEADRLQSLLSRMLGPNAPPVRRRVNLHEVIERVRTLIQAEANPGITIVRDYDPSIPDLVIDADQMIQAILNITRNALQAVGNEGRIVLQTRTQRRFTIGHRLYKLVAKINIIDNGPGIPPAIRENIFYPMISGRPEGTGLGLSIAQSIVSQQGGLIEYESRPGETVFTIILPIEEPHDE